MAKAVRYRSNIWIWEATPAYRREVEHVLAIMAGTQSGQTLFRHINARAKWLVIQPFHPTKKDPLNAYAQEKSVSGAAPLGYVAETTTLNLPFGASLQIPTAIGTGKGSDVRVHFHPASWYQLKKNIGYTAAGAGPAETLYHEMIHGLRELGGLLRYNDKVPGEPSFDSVEEFYSILAANVYRSERGFTALRTDHSGWQNMDRSLASQGVYYQHYKALIDQWFKEQHTYCLEMARTQAKFNPFREAAVELKLMSGPATSMRL